MIFPAPGAELNRTACLTSVRSRREPLVFAICGAHPRPIFRPFGRPCRHCEIFIKKMSGRLVFSHPPMPLRGFAGGRPNVALCHVRSHLSASNPLPTCPLLILRCQHVGIPVPDPAIADPNIYDGTYREKGLAAIVYRNMYDRTCRMSRLLYN